MTTANLGLLGVPTERLRTLLSSIYRQQTPCPLTPLGLASLGLQDWANLVLAHLRGLDERAVRAVLVAVIAERGAAPADG